jgi:TetR/AcrR family transcriptional regulator, repressor of fatR-cypB operon
MHTAGAGTRGTTGVDADLGPRPDKREQILSAALELFAERTFAGCAVPLVADAAGVATGTIYRYFPSKEALVNALYQRWKSEMKRRLLDDRVEAASAQQEFHLWWRALCDFVHDHPVAFEFLEMHHHEPYLDETSRALALEVDLAALTLAERGQATGEIRDLPAPVLVALVFGAFTGVVRGIRAYPDLFDSDALDQAEVAAWDLVRAATPDPQEDRP